MVYYILKILITTILIVTISEIARRNSFAGAILASIPTVSILAMIWLYVETKNADKVISLSTSIFWLIFPTMAFFVSFPIILRQGLNFYLSIIISILITFGCYWLMLNILKHFGIKF